MCPFASFSRSARQDIDHNSFSNNRLFFRHGKIRLLPKVRLKINPSGERGQSLATFLAPGERRILQLTDRAAARRPKEGGLLGVLGRCRPYPDGGIHERFRAPRIRNPSKRAPGIAPLCRVSHACGQRNIFPGHALTREAVDIRHAGMPPVSPLPEIGQSTPRDRREREEYGPSNRQAQRVSLVSRNAAMPSAFQSATGIRRAVGVLGRFILRSATSQYIWHRSAR